jgi:hypothetical protein
LSLSCAGDSSGSLNTVSYLFSDLQKLILEIKP